MTGFEGQIRYSTVARALHWSIAILIIVNIILGIAHDPLGEIIKNLMPIHKSIGLTVLALTLARIGWRMSHKALPLPSGMPRWEQIAARGTHHLFYVLMLVLPLSGWIMSSAGKYPLNWFGLFTVPKFEVTRGDAIVEASRALHGPLGFIFALLIVLHIGAALRHQFILKDGLLRRMAG